MTLENPLNNYPKGQSRLFCTETKSNMSFLISRTAAYKGITQKSAGSDQIHGKLGNPSTQYCSLYKSHIVKRNKRERYGASGCYNHAFEFCFKNPLHPPLSLT